MGQDLLEILRASQPLCLFPVFTWQEPLNCLFLSSFRYPESRNPFFPLVFACGDMDLPCEYVFVPKNVVINLLNRLAVL